MSENKESYINIFKATFLFGGAQAFNILISIIKSKFVAILLGSSGIGIVSLFTTTTALITAITSMGLDTSAVKYVAEAFGSKDEEKISRTVEVVRRFVLITGSAGLILTLTLSPWLSELAFGNKAYTFSFILISITLLIHQIRQGQYVVLQGLMKMQYMAKASMFGALASLVFSVPLYYLFGEKGIVPAIIITSITTLLSTWIYWRRLKIPKVNIDKSVFKAEGGKMLQMGFLISISSLSAMATAYIVRIFISNSGSRGLEDVGLFAAGFVIIGTYAGMIFTAMGTDLYPRLAAVSNDDLKCKEAVNQQAEISILLLAPILIFFFIFIKWIVIILYSNQFLGITHMIYWASLGLFFKAGSLAMSYLFLAKSEKKVYIWNELSYNIYLLILNIVSYYYWGLTGLGISYLISYILFFIQVFILTNRLYSFTFSNTFWKIFGVQFFLILACFLLTFLSENMITYFIRLLLLLLSAMLSFREMDKRLNLKAMILNFKNKIYNK